MVKPLLQGRQLSKHYVSGHEVVHVFRWINCKVFPGDCIGITGASGSGKSTLLQVLAGLEAPSSGTVLWGETDITLAKSGALAAYRNRYLGFVYQFHHLLAEFTALENVALPMRIGGGTAQEALCAAERLLEAVGLQDKGSCFPGQLSGGERQRVAIARALINQPRLILADEPTGNLDEKNTQQVFTLLKALCLSQGSALLVVTHDLTIAHACPVRWQMHAGALVEEGSL